MALFDFLKPKKVKKGGVFIPSYLRKVRVGGGSAEIPNTTRNTLNEDYTTYRLEKDVKTAVRKFSKVHPDLSHSLNSFIRFIITDKFKVVAQDLETGTIDSEATKLVQSFVMRLNYLPTNYNGFDDERSLPAVSETLLHQLLCNGDMMAELVLDSLLLPSHIQPVSTNDLKFENKGGRAVPYLESDSEKIYLDTPAIQRSVLLKDPEKPYADSFFEAAVQAVVASEEYRNDLRRAFNKASLPRVEAEIDIEKFIEGLPVDIQQDKKKLDAALEELIAQLDSQLNGLNPEDALVHYDTVSIKHLSAGNISSHDSVQTHAKVIDGMVASGLKTLPSIIGRSESQTTASTEAVLFLKFAENIQGRLNMLLSRLLTLAVRLHGFNVVVKAGFVKPNLRPEIELESFYAMKQSRIREQLSDGFISDEEASVELTGDLPSGNFVSLSGTGFFNGGTAVENPYSNTSVTGKGVTATKVQKDTAVRGGAKTNRTTG